MVKSASFSMENTCYPLHNANRKRRRKRNMEGIDGDLSANKLNSMDNFGIDKLSDDLLIHILSRVSIKEAGRASVLARRWRYLWMFAFGSLEFDDRDTATGTAMKREKFKSWVNGVLKIHQPRLIDSLIIRFSKPRREFGPISRSTYRSIDSWIYFAMQKEVQRFELDISPRGCYEFPSIDKLLSHSHEVNSPFRSLRSLRLVEIDIEDQVVQYFLASCLHLEQLCIKGSDATKTLQVVDPPNLKVLEITKCFYVQSLEIAAASLVSLTYKGGKNSLLFKKIPNLHELTLGGDLCDSFIFEPNEHSSYSVQLVKLELNLHCVAGGRAIVSSPDLPQLCSLKRLELRVSTVVGRSLLFFTSLIKASPHLHEFRIETIYITTFDNMIRGMISFPAVSEAEAVKFDHKNLKVVEIVGYVGCSSVAKFLLQLFKIARSLERVVIDTQSDYYDDPGLTSLLSFKRKLGREFRDREWEGIGATTRIESKECAEHLVSTFPQEITFIVK